MKIRANILSGAPGQALDWVYGTESARPPVFHTTVGRVVGVAESYEVDGVDLWATLNLEDGCPRAARAVAITAPAPAGMRIIGVLLTNLSREVAMTLMDRLRAGPVS
jgi:hypothetical protein